MNRDKDVSEKKISFNKCKVFLLLQGTINITLFVPYKNKEFNEKQRDD